MTTAAAAQMLRSWTDALTAWEIPEAIGARCTDPPWVLPAEVFSRRADELIARPDGASYNAALEALGNGGSILDVGVGGGAASLPLASRCASLFGVDAHRAMLDDFCDRARGLGVSPRVLCGTWPDVACDVPTADVVVCHHVLYNVADLGPFARALHTHARRRVVVEITERHPLIALNPYWRRFHDIDRPTGPCADQAIATLRTLGYAVRTKRWTRAPGAEYLSFDRMVDVTRRRLCLPSDRADEVAQALRDHGVDTDRPPDLGSSGRELVTIWWEGGAR